MRKAFDKYNRDLYKYNRRSREYAFNKRHKSPELRSAFRRYNRDNEKYKRELRKIQFQKYGAQYFVDGQKPPPPTRAPPKPSDTEPPSDTVPLDKFVVNVILNNDQCNSLRGTLDNQTLKKISESIASAINSDIADQVVNVIVTMDEPTAGYSLGSYPRCKKGKPCGNTCIPREHTCHIDKEQCIIITNAIFDALQ